MFLTGAALLVLLIHGNVGGASVRTTTAVRENQDRTFDKGELAKLIHQVIDVDDGETFDDAGETFDDAGETFDDAGETFDDVRKVTKHYNALDPLDFGYFDIMTGGLKSGMQDKANFLGKNYADGGSALNPGDSGYNVRVHVIKNPEVLEQYKKKLIERHKSTSSSSSSSSEDSLEYYRNVKNLVRRNAVYRLGGSFDQGIVRENPKLALRNGGESGSVERKNNRREDNRNLDKDTRHDDYNDKSQRDTSKLNKNKFNEEPVKKDIWGNIAKNINKWNNKNYKNRENNEKKQDADDNYKKTAYSEYGNWQDKESNRRETISKDWYSKNDSEKSKKNNSWANWKPKSMERSDLYKSVNNKGNKPKISEDWDRPMTYNDWDQHKKSRDWHQNKKSNYWEETTKNNNYYQSEKTKGWDGKKNNDYNQPDITKDWDRPKQNYDYDQPKKTSHRERTNDDSWGHPKPTKGIADFERESKADYIDKERLRKERKKKTANEREKAIVHNAGGISNNKPFAPKILEYYNPKSRIREDPGIIGSKSFGRTSIPFVGKRGIYEDK